MEKLKMHSPNFTDENIAKLAELFPGCVTESQNDAGELSKAIDFDSNRRLPLQLLRACEFILESFQCKCLIQISRDHS